MLSTESVMQNHVPQVNVNRFDIIIVSDRQKNEIGLIYHFSLPTFYVFSFCVDEFEPLKWSEWTPCSASCITEGSNPIRRRHQILVDLISRNEYNNTEEQICDGLQLCKSTFGRYTTIKKKNDVLYSCSFLSTEGLMRML